MKKNFYKLYKVDINDPSNFDLLLDTTRLSSSEVFNQVTTFIDKKRYNEHLAGCDHLKKEITNYSLNKY